MKTCAAKGCTNPARTTRTNSCCSQRCDSIRYESEHRRARREKNREYRAQNREYVLAYARAYNESHREELAAAQRAARDGMVYPTLTGKRREHKLKTQKARMSRLKREVDALALLTGTPWSPKDDVVALDERLSAPQCAMLLGRTVPAVESRRHLLNERSSGPFGSKVGEPWTVRDDAVVMDPTLTNRQRASKLGRTVGGVKGRRRYLRARS